MENIDLLVVLNKKQIDTVVKYAEKNLLNFAKVNGINAGILPPIKENKNHTLKLEHLDITYSIEWCVGGYLKQLAVLAKGEMEFEDIITLAESFGYNMEADFELLEDYQVPNEVYMVLVQRHK